MELRKCKLLLGFQQQYQNTFEVLSKIQVRQKVYLPLLDNLHKIEIPPLILWGAQDQIIAVSHAPRAKQRLPDAHLHIFDNCGHVPNIECADEFNLLVADFLSDK